MKKILESTKFVVYNAKYVKINKEKIKEFCKNFNEQHINHWLDNFDIIKKLDDEEKLNFILIIDSMLFSFWGEPKWNIEYRGEKYDGANAMIYSFIKAIEEKIPILTPDYLKKLNENELKSVTKGNVEIPLIKERIEILNQIGRCLSRIKLSILMKESNRDLSKAVELIIKNIPTFDDYSIYLNKKVYFYKRVQLFISDIIHFFDNIYFDSKDQGELTACADYKLPQILRKLGIIEYSDELANKVDMKIEIPENSKKEVEIRASTVWAVEYIKNELKPRFQNITSIDIDIYLWNQGQIKFPNDKPYHLTRTIAY